MLRKLATQRPPPAHRLLPPMAVQAVAPTGEEPVPAANLTGTMLAVAGCVLTVLLLSGEQPSSLGRFASLGFGASLAVSLALDLRGGLSNMIRADILALVSFYFLTFFEFLFPQPRFDEMVTPEMARNGIFAALLGAVGLLLGRHLWRPKKRPLRALLTQQVPPGMLILTFWLCFFIGYLHMLLAVNFNVVAMVRFFMDGRFTQPWSRGRLGDWKALLVELGMFIYLIPPLAGIVIARRQRYPTVHVVLIVAALLFTLFYGFTGGTRNIIATYLVTLLIGYIFALAAERRKEIVVVGIACLVLMITVTPIMLAFRTVGLKAWLADTTPAPVALSETKTVYVDYNLWAICQLTRVFPSRVPYLGLEIPFNALIRPIPRAIWSGKPEGLSYSIEDAMGMEGLTISATFVGEAYMSGGLFGVLVTGLIFGAIFGFWNHLASMGNSELGILIYASGFFCAVITMRSLFAFSTSILPTAAAIVVTSLVVRSVIQLERKLAQFREGAARQRAVTGPGPRR